MLNSVLFPSLLVAAGVLAPPAAQGQIPTERAAAGPEPHFVAAWAPEERREAERSSLLARRVSLELRSVSLDAALKALTNQARLRITYSPSVLPPGKLVTISAGDVAVVTALTKMLYRSGLDVVVDRDGALALVVCRHAPAQAAMPIRSGSAHGRVTDRATGSPLAGAFVTMGPKRWSATTDAEGRYRIVGVRPGTYTVRVRSIGHGPASVPADVRARRRVTADFRLTRLAQRLDELVTVTPAGMQTRVRALPSPVTVITAEQIERQRPATLGSVFRQVVPSGVSADIADAPAMGRFSARGASSLSGTGAMKVFVDGIESSEFDASAVDPASVERVEVIRGPQAATVFGADAAGGVVQIITKRGDPAPARPEVMAQALGGILETPYPGFSDVLRQQYTGSVRGGGPGVSYNVGGGYTRQGDRLPHGEISEQSSPSVYAGVRYSEGIITADLHGRYLRNNLPVVLNPQFLTAGVPSLSRPRFTPGVLTNETYGTRISAAPTSWWRNQLTLGFDRFRQDERQARRRLATPADTLFSIFHSDRRKVSLFFNSSATRPLGAQIFGTLTAGFDHYRLDAISFSTANALRTQGPIETHPAGAFTEGRAAVTNTGYFGQAEASWRETLFLTAGLRAEENSAFGADIAVPVSPRVGLSVVRELGSGTLKLRGAWGRAIRIPSLGAAFGEAGQGMVSLPNTLLLPEEQGGWEGGIDLIFGEQGSFSVTGFTQSARNLIALVPLPSESLPTFQSRNVAAVSNRGLEIEAALSVGLVRFHGQYGYVRSRIENLGSGVLPGGQLEVGDRPQGVPSHTAGASLSTAPAERTTVTAAVTYVGSRPGTDLLALFRCYGITGPCRPTLRDYVITFPGLVKFSLAATQGLTRQLEAILSVDNITNNLSFEGSGNSVTVNGRTIMVGVRARL